MSFLALKQKVQSQFEVLLTGSTLFFVEIDKDKIWDLYLDGFTEETRQGNTCNCCKSFLRQWSGIVAIQNNKKLSLWDIELEETDEYFQSVKNIRDYIHSLPVRSKFINDFVKLGTDKNYDPIKDVNWNHFFLKLPTTYVVRGGTVASEVGEFRTTAEVLQRGLETITTDALQTVVELTNQNSLYRGSEFVNLVKEFSRLKELFVKLPDDVEVKRNFCMKTASMVPPTISRLRNAAIGTLLVDLSEGVLDLDACVSKYEVVMAPANYKRPTALVTPKMVEQAKEKLTELGLQDSLERRFAVESDLDINDILFVDKSSTVKDVFSDLATSSVSAKSFSKAETISIEKFIKDVLPTSSSVELLVENNHLSNLITLITGVNKDAKPLFKWNNLFSWSYVNAIADSMKERVKSAGGNVEGVLRFSIEWNHDGKNSIDFDAHAKEPNGTHIYYGQYNKSGDRSISGMSGNLDVDIRFPGKDIAVENIVWSNKARMQDGNYNLYVNNFSHSLSKGGFKAQVEFDGIIHEFEYPKNLKGDENVQVAVVNLKNGKFTISSPLNSKESAAKSVEKWGTKTQNFVKVKNVMLSPNHWGQATGNKHYIFVLENCICDETPRPFFNEFLKQEFDENRKVFEVLGSKLKVEPSQQQLSGLGFSETQRNEIFVRVKGSFERVLKVTF
jgi:hypothetical protein